MSLPKSVGAEAVAVLVDEIKSLKARMDNVPPIEMYFSDFVWRFPVKSSTRNPYYPEYTIPAESIPDIKGKYLEVVFNGQQYAYKMENTLIESQTYDYTINETIYVKEISVAECLSNPYTPYRFDFRFYYGTDSTYTNLESILLLARTMVYEENITNEKLTRVYIYNNLKLSTFVTSVNHYATGEINGPIILFDESDLSWEYPISQANPNDNYMVTNVQEGPPDRSITGCKFEAIIDGQNITGVFLSEDESFENGSYVTRYTNCYVDIDVNAPEPSPVVIKIDYGNDSTRTTVNTMSILGSFNNPGTITSFKFYYDYEKIY